MSTFISNFIHLYSEYDPSCKKWTPSQVRDKLIELIDNNDSEDIKDPKKNESLEKDKILITNGLLSETFNKKEEEDKAKLITKLLNGKGIRISKLAKRFKETINTNIILDRKSILNSLKNKIEINIIYNDEDDFNDNLFIDIVLEGKKIINEFIERYKIKKYTFDSQVFDDILINYQTFNQKSLHLLNEYIKKLETLYNLYSPFIPIFNQIEKLINILKNNMKDIPENYSNCINKIYSKLENNIISTNSQFETLNKEMKSLREDNMNEINKLKDILKEKDKEFKIALNEKDVEINNIKARLINIENFLLNIREEFVCPIAYEVSKKPVMTPSGNIYEEERIKTWLRNHSYSPISHKPLNEAQLIYSVHLRNAFNELHNMKQIK